MSGNATKYPTVDELVTGMTSCSDLGVTSGWDMLVSYSLDTLNTLLTKLWKTDTKVVSELKLSTVETNYQTGTQDTLDWVIALGAPSLKFTMDEKAELLMALSGTWQVQGTDSTGKAFDVFHIPKDFYLRATVPIALVKAGKKGQIVKKNPRRNEEDDDYYISFDNEPGAAIHIVFDFEMRDDGALFKIIGPDSAAYAPFNPGLSEHLCSWFSVNVDAIHYSLASFTNVTQPDTTYLVPDSIAFSIYTGLASSNVGCLSVYIKTVGSENEPGKAKRIFALPNGGANSFPIPEGYTASIIIRHKVFAEKFLQDSLKKATSYGGNTTFKDGGVSLVKTDSGFGLDLRVNSRGVGEYPRSTSDYWREVQIDDMNWDFGGQPLALSIDPIANAKWSYEFSGKVGWSSEYYFHDGNPPCSYSGTEKYKSTLNKTQHIVESADEQQLRVVLDLEAGDWKTDYHPGGLAPGEIADAIDKFQMPAFTYKLSLDYLAATNIFAPNKQRIRIPTDTHSSVHLPYDVLLLGNVVDITPSGSSLATGQRGTRKVCDKRDGHRLGAPIGTTADFIHSLATGEPILSKAMTALSANTDEALDNFLGKCDYDITADGLEDAIKTSEPGPAFDVRSAAGIYSFDEPSDLASSHARMLVDSATGRIYIDDKYVGNTTNSKGHVVWIMDGAQYEVQFDVGFDDGIPKPITFKGERRPPQLKGSRRDANIGADPTIPSIVSGKQLENVSPDDFTRSNPAYIVAWVVGVLGFCYPFVAYFLHKFLKMRDANRDKEAEFARKGIDRGTRAAIDFATTTVDNTFANMDEATMAAARQTVLEATQGAIDRGLVDAELSQALAETAATEARNAYLRWGSETLMEDVLGRMHGFAGPLGPFTQRRIAQQALTEGLRLRAARFHPDAAYMLAITEQCVAVRRPQLAVEAQQEQARLDAEVIGLQGEIAQQQVRQRELRDLLEQGEVAEERAELDKLTEEIADKATQIDDTRRRSTIEGRTIAELQAGTAAADADRARQRADHAAEEFFKKPVKGV